MTTKHLPISLPDGNGNMHIFVPDARGMYNLTDMWRVLGLPRSKQPSRWNNETKRHLERERNFVSVNGDAGFTFATETGTIAYAMWVSTEFYSMVIATFIAVRNDAVLSSFALEQLAVQHRGMFQHNARKLRAADRLDRWRTMPWHLACYLCGIDHPDKARSYVWQRFGFWSVRHTTRRTEYQVTYLGERHGFECRNRGNYGTELALTRTARHWLLDHANEINEATA